MEKETKTAEQVAKELGEKVKADFKNEIDGLKKDIKDAREDGMTKSEAQSLLTKFEDLQTRMDNADAEAQKGKGKDGYNTKSLDEQIYDSLKEKAEELKAKKDTKGGDWTQFEVKAAGTMFVSHGLGAAGDPVGNYTGSLYTTVLEPGITGLPRREPFLRQTMNTLYTSKPNIGYVQLVNRDGSAEFVKEGSKKAQIDFDLEEKVVRVQKVAAFIKTSKENLDDLPFMQSLIRTELSEALELEIDERLWSGTGTAPDIMGLMATAQTISVAGTGFSANVQMPNRFDVMKVVQSLIQQRYYNPTHIFVNPQDKTLMELTKDENGNYVLPPFGSSNRTGINGLTVVANNLVTVGEFLMGDMSKSNLAVRETINFQIGHENDDFTKNLVTILAEARLAHYIKTNHVPAFAKGNFATIQAAITAA